MKVLLVANWDWVIYNFRMPLARALRQHGYDVALVFPFGNFLDRIRQEGFRCINWSISRCGANVLEDARAVRELARIYAGERPRLVHHFTIKPSLYGSLAARWGTDGLVVINTFTGLGFMFSDHVKARTLLKLVAPVLRYALHAPRAWTVFHERADLDRFVRECFVPVSRAAVVPGSGVDVHRFFPNGSSDHPTSPTTIVMAGRMLRDKGVEEFVEAARVLRQKRLSVRCWLAGNPDPANPTSISESVLREWHRDSVVEWLGHCEDMAALLRQAHIAVLPSHHEATPRFLLEAAASGLPVVATDIAGCRAIVRHGENGFLVPVRDSHALAAAIEDLVRDPSKRRRMGQASREVAVRQFDENRILAQWLALYARVLRMTPATDPRIDIGARIDVEAADAIRPVL